MRSYRPLFRLSLMHEYFSGGEWPGVELAPTGATGRLVKACGLVFRSHGNTLNVLFDSETAAAVPLVAEETSGQIRIGIAGNVRDRTFRNYTDFEGRIGDSLPCFTNEDGGVVTPGGLRISKQDRASAADLIPLRDLVSYAMLSPAEARTPPDFLFDLRFDPASVVDAGQACPHFVVGFGTRTLRWNYFLMGPVNRDNLFIVDLDERVEFEPLGDRFSVANRPAQVFRSTVSLPLQENSALRFQLRERGNGSGKVLIKRLPVAATNFALQTVDGREQLVSNLYVNF